MTAALVILDALIWLGLVWLGFFVHQYLQAPHWLMPAFLVPGTSLLWSRIGTTLGELIAVVMFLIGAGIFFAVADNFDSTRALPDMLSYAICAGASLAGFRTWQPAPDDEKRTRSS